MEEGAIDGYEDGIRLGEDDGSAVDGFEVGSIVLGLLLGIEVGSLDGKDVVGNPLGAEVGVIDTLATSTLVGLLVGWLNRLLADGIDVGKWLDTSMGLLDG